MRAVTTNRLNIQNLDTSDTAARELLMLIATCVVKHESQEPLPEHRSELARLLYEAVEFMGTYNARQNVLGPTVMLARSPQQWRDVPDAVRARARAFTAASPR